MNPSRRRCYSEQLASSNRHPIRVIPPHKAAKIREAQLHQGTATSSGLAYCNDISSNIAIASQTNRQVSAPTSLSTPSNSSGAIEQRTSQTKLPGQKQQVDGTAHFPSIDAVIAGSSNQDKRRAMAEAEFYEQVDKDGVIRRTSILRPVNKEDCLVVRGANPRTGLITPEANSVADALDIAGRPKIKRRDPPAQWKLEGDQWVSVMPQEQEAEGAIDGRVQPKNMPRPAHLSPESARSGTARNVSPLTETNLQSLAYDSKASPSTVQVQTPPGTPLDVIKIRRKPIGSPPKHHAENRADRLLDRHPSNETVVRTPPADNNNENRSYDAAYFSPEDVGRGPGVNSRPRDIEKSRDTTSFLEVPVRRRNMTTGLPRGFTGRSQTRDQLQQSLRTNSGPYPLPASRHKPVPTDKYGRLLDTSYQSESQRLVIDSIPSGRRAYPQPARRAYLPDAATLHDHKRLQLQQVSSQPGQDRHAHRRVRMQETISEQMAGDLPGPARARRINALPLPNTTCTSTSTSTPTSSKRSERRPAVVVHEDTRSRPLTPQNYRDEHKATAWTSLNQNTNDQVSETQIGDVDPEQRLIPARRPLMGPRSQESRRVPNTVVERTIMAPGSPSSMTGTKDSQPDEDEESEDSQGSDENKPPYSTGTGDSTEPGDELVVFEARNFAIPEARAWEETDMRDHSICCPECCVQYDCHEGCLGHPSPAASVADSEASSLRSMGVFDASFETSVKAVNQVLLEPPKNHDSKLVRLRTAFVGGPRSKPSSPTRTTTRQDLMKRTMRKSPTPQDTSRRHMKGPREPDPKQAVTAAVQAMDVGSSSKGKVDEQVKSSRKTGAAPTDRPATRLGKKAQLDHEANKGRRVSEKVHLCSERVPDSSEETLVESPAVESQDETDRMSVLSRMSSLMRRPAFRWSYIDDHPALVGYAHAAAMHLKEWSAVVLSTASTFSVMAFDYKRTGTFALPGSTSASELLGNCLRSILYLMIAACIYAAVVKVMRVVLVVLRIVLFPVKVCAWIIG
ncbi:hypothetical protein PMZ80_008055 [Knufia obscura]|uniref:Uncharacterized protein n=1 Tax=Knufia obscura TaxID=1635080 RepID=A0ABR0RGG4_9EURO|nr:hypothetical protein PMZ80_008055 [Knufia obscura]